MKKILNKMKLNEKKERKINGVMWYFWLINDYEIFCLFIVV